GARHDIINACQCKMAAVQTGWLPKVRGRARSNDCKVLSGIIYVKRYGLRWQDAPAVYGPYKTLYNRFARWSRMGIFAKIFQELARPGAQRDTLLIDSTFLKAHRTAASLRKKGIVRGRSDARKAA
ncbi:transposase, partial [Paracoccus lichenicola]|uniref:transposase n=1 Tax=Paracoccus lichenicola TaxID=2665644 RepID=UPI002E1A3206